MFSGNHLKTYLDISFAAKMMYQGNVLKSLFKNYLPEDIINRKKVGFPVPISKIFNNNNDPMDQWLEFNIRTLNIEY